MQISPGQIDPDATKVLKRLRHADFTAYCVGGCVRDLLLGLKPKDFDIATSATPNDLRRLFRNCRIIGRRFRLAHIFFGAKIIETSTFRANPREGEDDGAAEGSESQDLLIRRDNVFGTAEEDARRRDFTVNGLFYDIDTGQVIDYVDGMKDLEARLVRTIGDPDIRFREDPVRILRAIKFAARCSLSIEPETYRRMMEHANEIQKCAQARVSEEFYRLLRAGAARRSVELLRETNLLRLLVPTLDDTLASSDDAPEAVRLRARIWAYLAALDRSTGRRDSAPSNALILSTILFPSLRDALHPDSNRLREDVGLYVNQVAAPMLTQLKASRRDSELATKILLATRWIFPSSNPNRRRPRFAGREFLDDALRLHEIVTDAETLEPELVGRPLVADGETPAMSAEAEERLAHELEAPSEFERRRRGGGREPRVPGAPRADRPDRGNVVTAVSGNGRTPIPDLGLLIAHDLSPRLPFLGTGGFGGRWSTSD